MRKAVEPKPELHSIYDARDEVRSAVADAAKWYLVGKGDQREQQQQHDMPVRERSEQLLGEAATRPGIEITLEDVKQLELGLATQRREEAALMSRPKRGQKSKPAPGKPTGEVEFTMLDRLHRAMLLFGLGRSTLLRQVLETELRQSKRFERLALALNALYPESSDERRMLEGVQAAMRGVR